MERKQVEPRRGRRYVLEPHDTQTRPSATRANHVVDTPTFLFHNHNLEARDCGSARGLCLEKVEAG